MEIENKIIETIDIKFLLEKEDVLYFKNCIIENIDLIGVFELKIELRIENCIISNLQINSCWFTKGFVFKNNIVKNTIDYQMGGHNVNAIIIEGNIFLAFFSFFDCQFEEIIRLKNNIFRNGTNILGNKGKGYENSFERGFLIEENIGELSLNIV